MKNHWQAVSKHDKVQVPPYMGFKVRIQGESETVPLQIRKMFFIFTVIKNFVKARKCEKRLTFMYSFIKV